jgi:hypothetical protein
MNIHKKYPSITRLGWHVIFYEANFCQIFNFWWAYINSPFSKIKTKRFFTILNEYQPYMRLYTLDRIGEDEECQVFDPYLSIWLEEVNRARYEASLHDPYLMPDYGTENYIKVDLLTFGIMKKRGQILD